MAAEEIDGFEIPQEVLDELEKELDQFESDYAESLRKAFENAPKQE